MKAQLRLADRSGAKLAAIFGAEEEGNGTVTLRDLRGDDPGKQETMPREELEQAVRAWGS